jgi:MFS family permease
MGAFSVYMILEFSSSLLMSLLMSLIFTANVVYHVTVVELYLLQLVLVGTILETTVFIFEVPTGVLADVENRRLSVIIGYALMGLGFIVEGSFPFFRRCSRCMPSLSVEEEGTDTSSNELLVSESE